MTQLKSWSLLEADLGGENVRFDTGTSAGDARTITLSGKVYVSQVFALTDLVAPLTVTAYSCVTQPLLPDFKAIAFLLDPDDTYADDLSRSSFASGKAPVATIQIFTADAVAGVLTTPATPVNEASALVIDLYREVPFILPGAGCRSGVTQTSQNKAISTIKARNNSDSGFGTVNLRMVIYK